MKSLKSLAFDNVGNPCGNELPIINALLLLRQLQFIKSHCDLNQILFRLHLPLTQRSNLVEWNSSEDSKLAGGN